MVLTSPGILERGDLSIFPGDLLPEEQTPTINLDSATSQALIESLKKYRAELTENYNETRANQGFLGRFWNGCKNLTGLGAGSDKVDKILEELNKSIAELEKNPDKLPEIYEKITGRRLTANEIQKLQNGENLLSDSEAAQSTKKFEEGQEMAADVIADVAAGISSLVIYTGAITLAPVTGGASIAGGIALAAASGAAIKTGIKYIDARVGGREYDSLGYDLATGGFAGVLAPITGGIGGAAGRAVAKTAGVEAIKLGAKETAAEGARQTVVEGTKQVVANGVKQTAVEGATQTAAQTATEGAKQGLFRTIEQGGQNTIQGLKTALLNPTGYKYTGGNIFARSAAYGTEFATDGALGGGIYNSAYHVYTTGELDGAGKAFIHGAAAGAILAPVIGGGIKAAGYAGSAAGMRIKAGVAEDADMVVSREIPKAKAVQQGDEVDEVIAKGKIVNPDVPKYLYHLTNRKAFESMLEEGKLKPSTAEQIQAVFTVERSNALTSWIDHNSGSGINSAGTLLIQVAKNTEDLVLLKIPTKGLPADNFVFRSYDEFFADMGSYIDRVPKKLLEDLTEGRISYEEYLRESIKYLPEEISGHPMSKLGEYVDTDQTLEYAYKGEIPMDIVQIAGEAKFLPEDLGAAQQGDKGTIRQIMEQLFRTEQQVDNKPFVAAAVRQGDQVRTERSNTKPDSFSDLAVSRQGDKPFFKGAEISGRPDVERMSAELDAAQKRYFEIFSLLQKPDLDDQSRQKLEIDIEKLGVSIESQIKSVDQAKIDAFKFDFDTKLNNYNNTPTPDYQKIELLEEVDSLIRKALQNSSRGENVEELLRKTDKLTLEDDLMKPLCPLDIEEGVYDLPYKFAAAYKNNVNATGSPYITQDIPEIFSNSGLTEAEVGRNLDKISTV